MGETKMRRNNISLDYLTIYQKKFHKVKCFEFLNFVYLGDLVAESNLFHKNLIPGLAIWTRNKFRVTHF